MTYSHSSLSQVALSAARGRSTPLPHGSQVRVGRRSQAEVAFARQAVCRFGVKKRETSFVTRWRGGTASPAPLYWQRSGDSYCTFGGNGTPQTRVDYFCDVDPGCPVEAELKGRSNVVTSFGSTATSRTASGDLLRITPIVLDICSTSFRVDVDFGNARASVSGSGYSSINGKRFATPKRVVIRHTETRPTASAEWSSAITASSETTDDPTVCGDEIFQEQAALLGR
ncbi:MAG: hypothetical protein ITG02_06605 [Patulibacter sp.]|nr:hypothetical protein [Patulibacter sp.]